MRRGLLPLLCWLVLVGLAGCGVGSPPASPASGSGPSGGSASGSAGGPCADVAAPPAKTASVSQPTGSLAADKTYVVRLETSCGRIDITLDQADNPKTAASFAHLASEGYLNDTTFHRIVPGFVVQGGDPAGDGTGGPDWKVTEAPPQDTRYLKGVVAMAKTQAEPAGTSGSQFFIVVADDAGLPADYAVAGRVTAGQDVADAIAGLAQPGSDGPPPKPIVITSATLVES